MNATMPSPDFRGFCFNKALFLKQRSSEMFNTERVPVKVYRWDDAGAPKLTTDAGAFKTVLKACLVTGYGEGENRKEPLGWEIHQETETAAYFRSKHEKSSKPYLLVNGSSSSYYDSISAKFKVSADLQPHVANDNVAAEAGNSVNELYCKYRRDWILIGTERAIWLIVGWEYNRYLPSGGYKDTPSSTALFFGDFASAAPFDASNSALMTISLSDYSINKSFNSTATFSGGVDNNIPVRAYIRSLMSFNSKVNEAVDGIAKKLIATPFYLFDRGSLRGLLPGCLGASTSWFSEKKCFEQYRLDNSPDEFLIFTTGYSEDNGIGKNFLINLTAWDM
ncbi:hypothetical protein [Neisseria sicca]|uniref:hypothetical protein n=1 Tax=Neisseria sicca TaxID=490 RepID=UPI0028EF8C09|nr:hypothetical protein [Neisseria sicca]